MTSQWTDTQAGRGTPRLFRTTFRTLSLARVRLFTGLVYPGTDCVRQSDTAASAICLNVRICWRFGNVENPSMAANSIREPTRMVESRVMQPFALVHGLS